MRVFKHFIYTNFRSWKDVNFKDCIEMATFPGLYKLCLKYIIPGSQEIIKSIFPSLTVKDLQQTFPGLESKDIIRSVIALRNFVFSLLKKFSSFNV